MLFRREWRKHKTCEGTRWSGMDSNLVTLRLECKPSVLSVPGCVSNDRFTCTMAQVSCCQSALRPRRDSFTPQIRVFWDVTLCQWAHHFGRFGRSLCLHLQHVMKLRHYYCSKRLESLTQRRRSHPSRFESSVRPLWEVGSYTRSLLQLCAECSFFLYQLICNASERR
jgi:hypothetical protein